MWFKLIDQYWQICLFKQTPANTPYSPLLLFLAGVLFFLLLLVQWMMSSFASHIGVSTVLLLGCLLLSSYACYTGFLLFLFHLSARMVQTLTCLLMTHTIVHLFSLPLLLVPIISMGSGSSSLPSLVGVLYLVLTLLLSVWQFMITVHIYREALTLKYLGAVLASLGLLGSNILIVSLWR